MTDDNTSSQSDDNMSEQSNEDVVVALKKFVRLFVDCFENQLCELYTRYLQKNKNTIGNISDLAIQLNDVDLSIIDALPSIPLMIGKGVQYFLTHVENRYNRYQVEKLIAIINEYLKKPDKIRNVLITSGIDVFQKFECQFMNVYSSFKSEIVFPLMVREAVKRAMRYLGEKRVRNISKSIITKGVVLGNSAINFYSSEGRITVKDTNEADISWDAKKIYEKVGLLINNDCYLKKGTKSGKYGFRTLFRWEDECKVVEKDKSVVKIEDSKYVKLPDTVARCLKYKRVLTDVVLEKLKNEIIDEFDSSKETLPEETLMQFSNNFMGISDFENKMFYLFNNNLVQNGKYKIMYHVRIPVSSFTGRKQILEDMHGIIQRSSGIVTTISHTVAISGLGGIGKSELARKYIAQYGHYYDSVIWINGENETTLNTCFLELADKWLCIKLENEKDKSKINIRKAIQDVYLCLKNTMTLFVYDNVDINPEFLQFLPQHLVASDAIKPYVLITSRNLEWRSENIEVIKLEFMEVDDAMDLVRNRLDNVDETNNDDIRNLVDKLNKFPLAMQQAIACIVNEREYNNQYEIKDFLVEFDQNKKRVLDRKRLGCDIKYNETTFTTWKITIEKIAKNVSHGPLAIEILYIMAYLYSDNIEKTMFSYLNDDNGRNLDAAVRSLLKYSLIEKQDMRDAENTTDTCFSIHKIVQDVTQLELEEKGKDEQVLKKTVELINTIKLENKYFYHFTIVWSHASTYKNIILTYYFKSVYCENNLTPSLLLVSIDNVKFIDSILATLEKDQPHKVPHALNAKNSIGDTALHLAAKHGSLNVTEYLVKEKKFNYNLRNNVGYVPLFLAVREGQLRIVKYYINQIGMNYMITNNCGNNILHVAAENGQINIIQYLLEEMNLNLSVRNNFGQYPIFLAVSRGHMQVVAFLIEKHVDFKMTDNCGNNILHLAAKNGHLDVVKYVAKAKMPDVNVKNRRGDTPLFLAVLNGHLPITKYFIEVYKADCNITDKNGNTILHVAAKQGDLNTIQWLQNKNVEFSTLNHDGDTPLELAVHGGHLDIVEYFIKSKHFDHLLTYNRKETCILPSHLQTQNQSVNQHVDYYNIEDDGSVLHRIAEIGQMKLLKFLVETRNVNINVKNYLGQLPIFRAAYGGHVNIIKYFIQTHKIEFKETDNNGDTILHVAAQEGQLNVIKYLIMNIGVNSDIRNATGNTPLFCAASKGRWSIVDYFIKNTLVDYNITNSDKNNILHIVAQKSNLNIVKFLVENQKVDYNVKNINGDGVLSFAALRGHLHVIKYFVEKKGVDYNLRNNYQENILYPAVRSGNLQTLKYFIEEKFANFNVTNNIGHSPLFCAALAGHIHIVKYLIKKNADYNIKDNHMNTILHLVAKNGNLEMTKYFVEEIKLKLTIKNDTLCTPLFCAIFGGHLHIIKYLIENHSVDYKLSNKYKNNILHLAVQSGQLNVIKYLIDEIQIDFTLKNQEGYTPLLLAAHEGYLHIVKYFIVEKIDDYKVTDNRGNNILHLASKNGQLDVVKYILREKKMYSNLRNNEGFIPLHCAVFAGHLHVVKYFTYLYILQHQNNLAKNILHTCVQEDKWEIIEFFLRFCRVNFTEKDRLGEFLIFNAVRKGRLNILKYCIEIQGVQCNLADDDGNNILHIASYIGQLDVIKYILDNKKIDWTVKNKKGHTPLLCASSKGHLHVIQHFVKKQIFDNTIKDDLGNSITHLVAINGNLKAIKYLVEKISITDLTIKNNEGYNPLFCAVSNGHLRIVKYLFAKHKDLCNETDIHGNNIFQVAVSRGQFDIKQYIERKKNDDITRRYDNSTDYVFI